MLQEWLMTNPCTVFITGTLSISWFDVSLCITEKTTCMHPCICVHSFHPSSTTITGTLITHMCI